MTIPSLIDQNGRAIPLGRRLGSPGGEGTVFEVANNPYFAAKVYHPQKRTQEVFDKLRAFIALKNPRLQEVSAWPTELLLDTRTKLPVGFTMPKVTDCQPIQHLYNPVQRLKCFPRAGWNFQVRAALNLAAAFDEIHRAGCLMGDVNERNELVSPQAIVRLIDCDSFQLRANGKQYLCEVGVAPFTPPELQGKSFRGLVRTENHDRFGLAVLIYQLLFIGRHPYMGLHKDDDGVEKLIANYRFAQGPRAYSWGMSPPPHTPTFTDIPPDLCSLYRRAFERGSEAGSRPRPAEWLIALRRLEQETAECSEDPGHKYWRGARSCVWCRLADRGGVEYYFGVADRVDAFAVDQAKLQDVVRRLNSVETIDIPYDRSRFSLLYPPPPQPLPENLREHTLTAKILGVFGGLCVVLMLLGIVRGFIFVIGLLGALVFGIWLTVHLVQSPWYREQRSRRSAYRFALDDLEKLEEEWEESVRQARRNHEELGEEIRKSVNDCRGMAGRFQSELRVLSSHAEESARLRHLRLHLIADADIVGIGAGRKRILASHNITTAADIDARAIRRIKGFGGIMTRNLLEWRKDVLRRFQFDPKSALSPSEQRSLAARFRSRQKQLLAEANQMLERLESLPQACRESVKKITPKLQIAMRKYEQANADVSLVEGKGLGLW